MSTMRDVAKRAGVSAMTVSRVLNDPSQVHPATKERVLEAMASIGYAPSRSTQSASNSRSRTIALVVADFTNPFFTQIAHGVELVARQFGYGVILHNTAEEPEREWESLVAIRDAGVSGVIWVPCGDGSNVSARILMENAIPTVLVDRIIPGVPSFDSVISDNRSGAKAVASHLLAHGRRPLATIMGNSQTSVIRDRQLGIQDALAEQGLPWDDVPVVYCDSIMPRDSLWSELTEREPAVSTVFAWNQIAAASLFRAARSQGVAIPQELMIGTFDNPDPYGITPGYFVVAQQDPFRMGQASAKQLVSRLSHPDDPSKTTLILPVEVQVGAQSSSRQRLPSLS